MALNIEVFSNFVCYVLTEKIILPNNCSLKSFPIGVNVNRLKTVMEYFDVMYSDEYLLIMEKLKGSKKNTFPLFMKAVMARCINLSVEPVNYGHFLLACSLIHRICAEYLGTTDCFLCATLANFCFISLYKRCYKEYFESKEDPDDTLDSYIVELLRFLNEKSAANERRKQALGWMSEAQKIMARLVEIEDESIPLTEYEQELLDNNTNSLPKRNLPVLPLLYQIRNPSMRQDSAKTDDSSTSMSSEEESASSVSKRQSKSPVAESIGTDFQKASTSAAADKAEEVDSETESEEKKVKIKRSLADCARYYRNIGYKPKRKRLDKPEFSDDSSSSSNMECDDESRVPDMYYFGNLMCKFCRSRCSCYAVQFIDKYCD